jgi:hypothetical protein
MLHEKHKVQHNDDNLILIYKKYCTIHRMYCTIFLVLSGTILLPLNLLEKPRARNMNSIAMLKKSQK